MKLNFWSHRFGNWAWLWRPRFYRDGDYFELSWGYWVWAVWPTEQPCEVNQPKEKS